MKSGIERENFVVIVLLVTVMSMAVLVLLGVSVP